MAAQPPMPPGNLHLNGKQQETCATPTTATATTKSNYNQNKNIHQAPSIVEAVQHLQSNLNGHNSSHFGSRTYNNINHNINNNNHNEEDNIVDEEDYENFEVNYGDDDEELQAVANVCDLEAEPAGGAKAKLSCSCTNISIMQLFHEMKQEFPTIPDAIVTQCVNENCHQRDNCIQMLKKELALNPIPVQTYPAKVLQQQQQQHHHQHQRSLLTATAAASAASTATGTTTKPPTLLKPTRKSPLPPLQSPLRGGTVRGAVPNCDSLIKQQTQRQQPQPQQQQQQQQRQQQLVKDNAHNALLPTVVNNDASSESDCNNEMAIASTRPRPTTLNLQSGGINLEQRRLVNAQLQQKIQQRQHQQLQHQQEQNVARPLRKAPLPPKPSNSFSTDSSCVTSPMSSVESEISVNVSLSSPTTLSSSSSSSTAAAAAAMISQQPSPIRHRSVITLQPEPPYARDFLSRSLAAAAAVATTPTATAGALSPSPQSPSTILASPSVGRKSFTSLNLTLRQPHTSTGAAQSTIDITAGPAASGTGAGITYSSSSFDARRGTQKNFQLTVTDAGSVFTAGCVRSPQPPMPPDSGDHVPPLLPPSPDATPVQSQCIATVGNSIQLFSRPTSVHHQQLQQLQMQQQQQQSPIANVFPYPTEAQNHVVASNFNRNHLHSNNSADNSPIVPHAETFAHEHEEFDLEAQTATIERQKLRRDKLANAVRDKQKRLSELEQEINILTEPVQVGESERLDREIKTWTDRCQQLLNLINDPQLNGSENERQNSAPTIALNNGGGGGGHPPQPFPRHRAVPLTQPPQPQQPPTPSSLRMNSLPGSSSSYQQLLTPNHGQHHSISAPSSACVTPQQPISSSALQEPPPSYAEYYQNQLFLRQQQQIQQLQLQQQQQQQQLQLQHQVQQHQHQQHQLSQTTTTNTSINPDEEEYLSESDDYEEPLEPWACNMCTFRNHPQLNICEACDYIRIKPGTIHIVPSGSGSGRAGLLHPPQPQPQLT